MKDKKKEEEEERRFEMYSNRATQYIDAFRAIC